MTHTSTLKRASNCSPTTRSRPGASIAADLGARWFLRWRRAVRPDSSSSRLTTTQVNPPNSVSNWRAPGSVDIGPGADTVVPLMFANAITHGVPIPRHGSVFGWRHRKSVTALIVVYANYPPGSPEPYWATMPRAGISAARWPALRMNAFSGTGSGNTTVPGTSSASEASSQKRRTRCSGWTRGRSSAQAAAPWHATSRALTGIRSDEAAMCTIKRYERTSPCHR